MKQFQKILVKLLLFSLLISFIPSAFAVEKSIDYQDDEIFDVVDEGLECMVRICRYALLVPGRVKTSDLIHYVIQTVDPANHGRLDEEIGWIEVGLNDSEILFWADKVKTRKLIAKSLIENDIYLTNKTKDDYYVEALVYTFREADFNRFFVGLEAGFRGANSSGLTDNSVLGVTAGSLVDYAAVVGSSLLRFKLDVAFGEGKAEKWIREVSPRRNGDSFTFSSTQSFFVDGVTQTTTEQSGFDLTGSFFKERGTNKFHLGENSRVFLGLKPSDEDLMTGPGQNQSMDKDRDGVTTVSRIINGTVLEDGVPKIVFDRSIAIEKDGHRLGTGTGFDNTTTRARLIVFLTISKKSTYENDVEKGKNLRQSIQIATQPKREIKQESKKERRLRKNAERNLKRKRGGEWNCTRIPDSTKFSCLPVGER